VKLRKKQHKNWDSSAADAVISAPKDPVNCHSAPNRYHSVTDSALKTSSDKHLPCDIGFSHHRNQTPTSVRLWRRFSD
jgi:hypothetical protein